MFRKIIITGVVFLSAHLVQAQDFHLTHYDAAKIYLNPAMTGMFDGYYRIHANYRNQWSAIPGRPFQTAAIAFDMPVNRYGVGAQILDNNAGDGNYNVLQLNLSAAYDLQLDKNNYHHLAFGMEAGVIQKSINYDKLYWGEQYTLVNDGTFDQTLPSGEGLTGVENKYLLDINAGALYYYAKDGARINPFVGVAAFNMNQPNESFYSSTSKLPMHFILHSGARIGINEKLQLQPRFLFMKQGNDYEMVFGTMANLFLPNSDSYLIFGPSFRYV
ncbi:MAG TPA: PorP/SprF family type IX secretion system membrane protein, partial [Bacteroidia bacterium]|nr:PorP/SprF family type IX secretion system membrane protein [Bacteroidia bacterium]